MDIQRAIDIVSRFGHLQQEEAEAVMNQIMSGDATQAQIAAYLMGLRMKGETQDEIIGSARAMRSNSHRVPVSLDQAELLDTCGTGGGQEWYVQHQYHCGICGGRRGRSGCQTR